MVATCPRCGQKYVGFPALSRLADAEICSDCGLDEGLRMFLGIPPMRFEDWHTDPRGRQ